ncbi:imm11 family protein [Variovorax sp. LT1R16]|uniref:imm11 family protein n=1 Tax=Variovorax sp. LT1R16 TaxID=3443728 RepID=UPI003F47A948
MNFCFGPKLAGDPVARFGQNWNFPTPLLNMAKLLNVDLRRSLPAPEASPELSDLNRLFDIEGFHLNRGRRFHSLWGDVRVQVKDDRESPPGLTDFFQTVPFDIVSKPFVELLERFDCACEFLPLRVQYKRNWLLGEYFALNVLAVVDDAVDRDRSKFAAYDEGPLEEVEHLELKPSVLAANPIAYLSEISRCVVSDELAAAISSAGMRGVAVSRPDEFRS